MVEDDCAVCGCDDNDDDIDDRVVVDDDNDAKEVIQSSTSLPRGNQVDGLPRVCSYKSLFEFREYSTFRTSSHQ